MCSILLCVVLQTMLHYNVSDRVSDTDKGVMSACGHFPSKQNPIQCMNCMMYKTKTYNIWDLYCLIH